MVTILMVVNQKIVLSKTENNNFNNKTIEKLQLYIYQLKDSINKLNNENQKNKNNIKLLENINDKLNNKKECNNNNNNCETTIIEFSHTMSEYDCTYTNDEIEFLKLLLPEIQNKQDINVCNTNYNNINLQTEIQNKIQKEYDNYQNKIDTNNKIIEKYEKQIENNKKQIENYENDIKKGGKSKRRLRRRNKKTRKQKNT